MSKDRYSLFFLYIGYTCCVTALYHIASQAFHAKKNRKLVQISRPGFAPASALFAQNPAPPSVMIDCSRDWRES